MKLNRRLQGVLLVSLLMCVSALAQENPLLEKYRKMALDHEQEVRVSQKAIEASESMVKAAKTDFMPKVDASGSYGYLTNKIDLGEFGGSQDAYNMNLTVTQPVYQGGAIKGRYDAAITEAEIAGHQARLSEQNTIYKLDYLYYSAVAKREENGIYRAYMKTVQQLVDDIQAKVDAELISVNDLYMAQVRLNDAEFGLMQSERISKIARMELNRIIGVDINEESQLEDTLQVQSIVYNRNSVMERALDQRPEIQMGKEKVNLNKNLTKITEARYNPRISVSANGFYGHVVPHVSTQADTELGLTASLNIPVFHWNQRRKEVSAQRINTDISALQLEKTTEVIGLEVNEAVYTLEETKKQVELTGNSLEKADQNLEVVTNRYNEGLVSIVNILDAQVYWQQAYMNHVEAKFNYNTAISRYKRSLGEL